MAIFTLAQRPNQAVHIGLSSDPKPLPSQSNQLFIETDTGLMYTDSTGAWVVTSVMRNHTHIVIRALADLPAPVAGVITLADNTNYEVNGTVNIGNNRIVCGIANSITGVNRQVDQIISTTTGDMFTVDSAVTPRGPLTFGNVTVQCPNGRMLNIIKTTLVFGDCGVRSTKIWGAIVDAPGVLIRNCGIQNGAITQNGLSFTGVANGFLQFYDNVCRQNAGILLNLGTAIFNDIKMDRNIIELLAGQTFCAGAAASANLIQAGQFSEHNFFGAGTPISGISPADAKWFFTDNVGQANTALIIGYGESLAESLNNTANFVNKLTLNVTPSATVLGTIFELGWYFEYGNQASNRGFEARVQIAGVTVGQMLWGGSNSGDYLSASGLARLTMAATTAFTIDFRESGGGTAKIRNARLRVIRG